eukprot:CAMPEP_0198650740 /NCGR_PEP_ID=MMETSP1467-20131203/5185_1 /TAXON_ID=1462469 /ORGANISM="unid. sp., Strain CCMP2135" /LENGTH=242 /DNA_ID=CAMNT_0044386599 /DNA_START=102 /DNA_END=825 /DNA_ORIENTATION=+
MRSSSKKKKKKKKKKEEEVMEEEGTLAVVVGSVLVLVSHYHQTHLKMLLEFLAHELAFGEGVPPLVLGAVGVVEDVERSRGDLFAGLFHVEPPGLALLEVGGGREHAAQRPAGAAGDGELLNDQSVHRLLGFGPRLEALALFQKLLHRQRQVDQRPVRPALDLEVPEQRVRPEELDHLVHDVLFFRRARRRRTPRLRLQRQQRAPARRPVLPLRRYQLAVVRRHLPKSVFAPLVFCLESSRS